MSRIPGAGVTRRLVFALPLVLAGCKSQEPNYYTLRALPGAVQGGGPRLVELRRIGLAGYLDRPEIVRNNSDYRLSIGGQERWGEPLGELVARVLAEDLNMRLSGSNVFTSAGTITADPDATIELDLQRFDADASGAVTLLAQVAVKRGRARDRAAARTVRLVVPPAGATMTDLVAAMSGALGQLADQVAGLVRGAG